MKLINSIKILSIALIIGMPPVYSADLTVDFINNAAFENTSYKKQEPKVINLFHKEDNIFKKKKKVNYGTGSYSIHRVTLT